MAQTTTNATADTHPGANRLIVGTVLAAITFWLFAQTTLNVAPTVREELRISESLSNIAVSIPPCSQASSSLSRAASRTGSGVSRSPTLAWP